MVVGLRGGNVFFTKHSAFLCRGAEHTVLFACWISVSAALPYQERALAFATRFQSWVQDHGQELLGSTN